MTVPADAAIDTPATTDVGPGADNVPAGEGTPKNDGPQYVTVEDFEAATEKARSDMSAQFGRVFQQLKTLGSAPPAAEGAQTPDGGGDPYAKDRARLEAESNALREQRAAMERQQVRQSIEGTLRGKGVGEAVLGMAVDSIMLRHGGEFAVSDNGLGEVTVTRQVGEFGTPQSVDVFGAEYLAGNKHLLPARTTGNVPGGDSGQAPTGDKVKIAIDDFVRLPQEEMESGKYEVVDSLTAQTEQFL